MQFEYVRSAPHGRKDPLGLTDKKDADDWWDDWRKRFPGYTDDQLKELRETFDRGCIGITCLYLGEKGNPSLQNCFATFGQAQGRQREMKSNGECSGKRGPEGNCDSEPQIFSVRFYSGGRTFKPDPTNGKIDMSQWTYEAKPGFVNFDYGYFDAVRGVWIHANHCAPGMIVYESVLSHYSRPLQDFDNQAFCVACEDFGKPGRLPAEPIKWDWKWWWSLF